MTRAINDPGNEDPDSLLETDADIARNARAIYLQAGITHAMPPAMLGELARLGLV